MEKIKAYSLGNNISSNSSEAYLLNKKSNFGERREEKVEYSPYEALFLVEKGKMDVFSKNKKVSQNELFKKFLKRDKKIQTKYLVFRDLRSKGYIVKSALKFGAEFRVYDKGARIDKQHAKWIVFTDEESKKITWHDFSSKNRVAHSTKKNLLLAIVDEEKGITYYEVRWLKP